MKGEVKKDKDKEEWDRKPIKKHKQTHKTKQTYKNYSIFLIGDLKS